MASLGLAALCGHTGDLRIFFAESLCRIFFTEFFLQELLVLCLPRPGVKVIFTGGHISLAVAFKGLNVILGLYKYNDSLTRGKELGAALPRVEPRCPVG